MLGGWPQFRSYGFRARQTESPLGFEAIIEELLNERPLAYAYTPKGRIGHIVAIIGFERGGADGGEGWLIAHDPLVLVGPVRIPYRDYAKMYGYDRHLRTYHSIAPR